MPSVICVLLVAVSFVTIARASLGPRGSTIAALMWLINAGIIEKDGSLKSKALCFALRTRDHFLAEFLAAKIAWLIWTVPFVFLGLGWLAKGPVHLLFFYA